MASNIQKRRPRLQWNSDDMEKAVKDVLDKQLTLGQAAKRHNVPKTSLFREVKKQTQTMRSDRNTSPYSSMATNDSTLSRSNSSYQEDDNLEQDTANNQSTISQTTMRNIDVFYNVQWKENGILNDSSNCADNINANDICTMTSKRQLSNNIPINGVSVGTTKKTDNSKPDVNRAYTTGNISVALDHVNYPKQTDKRLCGGCQENEERISCVNCNITLCGTCGKSHLRFDATKDHTLKQLQYMENTYSVSPMLNHQCSRHPQYNVASLCSQCEQLICTECINHHSGHVIVGLNDNPTALYDVKQSICFKLISKIEHIREKQGRYKVDCEFYQNVKAKLDEYGHDVASRLDVMHEQLDNAISDNSSKRARLDSLIGFGEEYVKNKLAITSKNPHILTDDIYQLEHFKESILSNKDISIEPNVHTHINDMFPNITRLNQLKQDLEDVLTVNIERNHVMVTPAELKYRNMRLANIIETGYDISVVGCIQKYGLRPCMYIQGMPNQRIIFCKHYTKHIIEYDDIKHTKQHRVYSLDVTIKDICGISGGRYIAFDGCYIYLLDNIFDKRDSILVANTGFFQSYNVCCETIDSVIECQYIRDNNNIQDMIRLSRISVTDDHLNSEILTTISLDESCYRAPIRLSMRRDRRRLVMVTGNGHIWTFDLGATLNDITELSAASRAGYVDINETVENRVVGIVDAMYVDQHDNMLIGDTTGHVYMFNFEDKQLTPLQKVQGGVHNITVHGRLLIVIHYNRANQKQLISVYTE